MTKCFFLVGVGIGHTQSVGAVAYSRYSVPIAIEVCNWKISCARVKGSFVVSGSQDQTLKLWNFKNLQSSDKVCVCVCVCVLCVNYVDDTLKTSLLL